MKRHFFNTFIVIVFLLAGCAYDDGLVTEDKQMNTVYFSDNLLVYPYSETTKTINGISFTDNGDGSITLSGKADKATNYYFISSDSDNSHTNLFLNGYYYLSGAIKDKCALILCYRYDGENINDNKADKGEGLIFEMNSYSEKYNGISIEIYVFEGAEFDNETIYPMLCQIYTENVEWKPYRK